MVKLPAISANYRLEHVSRRAPHLVNREYTLPLRVNSKPLLWDPAAESLRPAIEALLRVVVTPESFTRLPETLRGKVQVLASPYECGRVLEANERVILENKRHVLIGKGGGANTAVRSAGGMALWKPSGHGETAREQLRLLPFWKMYGVLDFDEARREWDGEKDLRRRGFDLERVLAVYEISELPDETGTMQPLGYFHDRFEVRGRHRPVYMIRAVKSNFRILEFMSALRFNGVAAIPELAAHALREYHHHEGAKGAGLNDYLLWYTGKIVRQMSSYLMEAIPLASGDRYDLGRNISFLAEDMDVGGNRSDWSIFPTWHSYKSFVIDQFARLSSILRLTFETLELHSGQRIDSAGLNGRVASVFCDVVRSKDLSGPLSEFARSADKPSAAEAPEVLIRELAACHPGPSLRAALAGRE